MICTSEIEYHKVVFDKEETSRETKESLERWHYKPLRKEAKFKGNKDIGKNHNGLIKFKKSHKVRRNINVRIVEMQGHRRKRKWKSKGRDYLGSSTKIKTSSGLKT